MTADAAPATGPSSQPTVINVHHLALQEIDRVVGNELTLDEHDTTRIRGILAAALSEAHPRRSPDLDALRQAIRTRDRVVAEIVARANAAGLPMTVPQARIAYDITREALAR